MHLFSILAAKGRCSSRKYAFEIRFSPARGRVVRFTNKHGPGMNRHRDSAMLGETFNPKSEFLISGRCRPHWSQAAAVAFIRFRIYDSIPKKVLDLWEQQKQEWLRIRGIDYNSHWSEILPTLSPTDQQEFHTTFGRCRETYLDTCHGRCLLKRPDLAQVVADALLHFDGDRYHMGDFVLMHQPCASFGRIPHCGGDENPMRFLASLHSVSDQSNTWREGKVLATGTV